MRNLRTFMKNEDGMGTVEVILIIVVLIGLVTTFKEQIDDVVDDIMKRINTKANAIN